MEERKEENYIVQHRESIIYMKMLDIPAVGQRILIAPFTRQFTVVEVPKESEAMFCLQSFDGLLWHGFKYRKDSTFVHQSITIV